MSNTKMPQQPLILCLGLPRSGSTWAFNIIQESLRIHDPEGMLRSLYRDELDQAVEAHADSGGTLLLKSHMPGASLRCLTLWNFARSIVTVRSPYDCIASLIERFAFSFADALLAVHQSCTTLTSLLQSRQSLILRYEDGFMTDPATIEQIANYLGFDLPEDAKSRLLEHFSADAVRTRLHEMQQDGVFTGKDPVSEIDAKTQWHYAHLGNGQIGKALETLTTEQLAVAGHALREVLPALGYERLDVAPSFMSGEQIVFGETGLGAACLGFGFALIESWGVWMTAKEAELQLKLTAPAETSLTIILQCRLGPSFLAPGSVSHCEFSVNGQRRVAIHGAAANGEYLSIAILIDNPGMKTAGQLNIGISSSGVSSPAELGLGPDTRQVGLGLISCQVVYT